MTSQALLMRQGPVPRMRRAPWYRSSHHGVSNWARRTFFFDPAQMQEYRVIRDVGGKPHVMGDDEHGAAFFGQGFDNFDDLLL